MVYTTNTTGTSGGGSNKRKKHHDKDKYYRLAKEHGYRSRASFKLAQMNRKFHFLESAKTAILDLCAAPGGWTQVCQRTIGNNNSNNVHIVAVDILPIRPFPSSNNGSGGSGRRNINNNNNNITTIVGDITTERCRIDIRHALEKGKSGGGGGNSSSSNSDTPVGLVDVVLHDGAPNIGSEYSHDAYKQNLLVLEAIRCSTHHLKYGGTLCTKIYRSIDYMRFVWLLQQLFHTVTPYKPKSSRLQSSEIYIIAQNYKAPKMIDSRLLDPKYVFATVDGETTGGIAKHAGSAATDSSHNNKTSNNKTSIGTLVDYKDTHGKRRRGGYDLQHLDATMRHIESVVHDFIFAGSTGGGVVTDDTTTTITTTTANLSAAIATLTRSTGLIFRCPTCDPTINTTTMKKTSTTSSSSSSSRMMMKKKTASGHRSSSSSDDDDSISAAASADKDDDDDDDVHDDDNNNKTKVGISSSKASSSSSSSSSSSCYCHFVEQHPFTTDEIKDCLSDLQVLNRADFKMLLTWRTNIIDSINIYNNNNNHNNNEKKQKMMMINKKKKRSSEKGEEELMEEEEEEEEDDDAIKMSTKSSSDRHEYEADDEDKETEEEDDGDDDEDDDDDDDEEEEAVVQNEMRELRHRRIRERKRQKKKERAAAAKRRRRAALGMDLNAIDVPDHMDGISANVFALSSITSKKGLDAAIDEEGEVISDDDDDDDDDDRSDIVVDDDDDNSDDDDDGSDDDNGEGRRLRRLEEELDHAYRSYLSRAKDPNAKLKTKMAKRERLNRRKTNIEHEDNDNNDDGWTTVEEKDDEDKDHQGGGKSRGISKDMRKYAEMLTKEGRSDDDDDSSSSSDDEDQIDDEPNSPDGSRKKRRVSNEVQVASSTASGDVKKSNNGSLFTESSLADNPLLHQFQDNDTARAKTARWFSNPLFANIMEQTKKKNVNVNVKSSTGVSSVDDDVSMEDKKKTTNKKGAAVGLSSDDVLASMPKTDKQIRHERRLKRMARDERKKERLAKKQGLVDRSGFEVVPGASTDNDDDDIQNPNSISATKDADAMLANMTEEQKKKHMEARKLIKAGMGRTLLDDKSSDNNGRFEVVSDRNKQKGNKNSNDLEDDDVDNAEAVRMMMIDGQRRPLSVKDDRIYDSDHEDYDSDDYAETLALGTMILRRSKEKAFVDASYNRFTWNDPKNLPEWFIDDEARHYKPQLPIPPELLMKMKEKMIQMSTKPIAKVAEARARKNKRAKAKLSAAKRKAEALANNDDMTEAMKLRAISKALRSGVTGENGNKNPGKKYVIAKKGRNNRGGKGIKVVDKRLKSDKRATERIDKKKRKGKQNKLVGSKRRRQHS